MQCIIIAAPYKLGMCNTAEWPRCVGIARIEADAPVEISNGVLNVAKMESRNAGHRNGVDVIRVGRNRVPREFDAALIVMQSLGERVCAKRQDGGIVA